MRAVRPAARSISSAPIPFSTASTGASGHRSAVSIAPTRSCIFTAVMIRSGASPSSSAEPASRDLGHSGRRARASDRELRAAGRRPRAVRARGTAPEDRDVASATGKRGADERSDRARADDQDHGAAAASDDAARRRADRPRPGSPPGVASGRRSRPAICQRQVSESQAASARAASPGPARTAARRPPSRSWYFSFLRPYVPAMPQQSWSMSRRARPGTSANRSSAGRPMPWLRSWHGAW